MPSDHDSDGTKRNISQVVESSDSNMYELPTSVRMMDIPSILAEGGEKRIVVAIGPEGGWTLKEYHQFIRAGFLPVHMGPRILRTDMAVPALLSLAHEWIHR